MAFYGDVFRPVGESLPAVDAMAILADMVGVDRERVQDWITVADAARVQPSGGSSCALRWRFSLRVNLREGSCPERGHRAHTIDNPFGVNSGPG